MKRKTLTLPLILLAVIFTLSCNRVVFSEKDTASDNLQSSQNAPTEISGGWDYPVKPGSEEWKMFQSNEEMVKACQIPEKILLSLSTDSLAELCLQYPLLNDIFAFDNLNNGFDKLFNDFNGIREFYKRKDMSSMLTKRYAQKIQSLSFLTEPHSETEKGYFIISVSVLEVLLSRVEQQEGKEVLQNLVTGYERKLSYIDYFKGFGLQTNFYSRGNIIAKIDQSFVEQLSQKERNAILFSGMGDERSITLIDKLSHQLIQ
jgi:hypothetical protein